MANYTLQRTSISLTVTVGGTTFRIASGITTDESGKFWNQKKQELKGEGKEVHQKNEFLKTFKAEIEGFILDAKKNKRTINKEDVKRFAESFINNKHNPELVIKAASFIEYYQNELDASPLKESSLKAKRITLNKFYEYMQKQGLKDITFEQFDVLFFNKFYSWLMKNHNYSIGYLDKFTKDIKAIMNKAQEEGINKFNYHTKFKRENRSKVKEDSFDIYLTEDEVAELWDLRRRLKNGDKQLLDLFLFQVYTAMRYIDTQQITKANFRIEKDAVYLVYRQIKTGFKVDAPILYKNCITLLKDNDWQLMKISDVNLNKGIKRIIKNNYLLEDMIKIHKSNRNETVMKADLVSSKTGRKTFATNNYIKGYPVQQLMKITGHKTEREFLTYVKSNIQDSTKVLLNFKDY